jgi:arginine-tRNA-protein transferase
MADESKESDFIRFEKNLAGEDRVEETQRDELRTVSAAQFGSLGESRALVYDAEPHPCQYIANQTAAMPLIAPLYRLPPDRLDDYLATGHRRSGGFLYFTHCPSCKACIPTRVWVDRFHWSRSFRRIMNRNDRQLVLHVSSPVESKDRQRLFHKHRRLRGLSQVDDEPTAEEYRRFLVESCCDSLEMSYWLGDQLVACSFMDVGMDATSAVYTYFDPDFDKLSLGTYAVLKQMEWTQQTGRKLLYLGMYVESNPHLNYKSRFVPQERYIDGLWQAASEAPKS